MKNYLLAAAIGDIAGSIYEPRSRRTKDYDAVEIFGPSVRFTDDTVMTFACAEALLYGLDMSENIRRRALQHPNAGYGGRFRRWIHGEDTEAYGSFGNGSAMRCSAAGWLADTEEECISLAEATAKPTHDHPEGVKGAVSIALAIFHLKNGKDKAFIRKEILNKYYPQWASLSYDQVKPDYSFDSTCQGSVGPAIISFLESSDYEDCLRLAISLGGDADTLAAIAGPLAYAYYRDIPEDLFDDALEILPGWMKKVNSDFDKRIAD